MPNSKRKNVAKARVFNNLKHNFPEQPTVPESIAVVETVFRNLAAEIQTRGRGGLTHHLHSEAPVQSLYHA